MRRSRRTLECPQCGGRISEASLYCCRNCGYVLDMARISFQGALRHDRYQTWRRRLEWLHAGLWALVSLAVVGVVALHPGLIMFVAGILGACVQVLWGRLIIARLKKR